MKVLSAFVRAFREPMISEADIVPTLRRAMIASDDSIRRLIEADPHGMAASTVVGPRKTLEGIGTCVAAAFILPRLLHVAHVGYAGVVLHRASRIRKHTLEHTLEHDPSFRERAKRDPDELALGKGVVLQALGIGPPPRIDVTRLELAPGDQIILGNLALEQALPALREIPGNVQAAASAIGRAMTTTFPQSPATVAMVTVDASRTVNR